MSRLQDQHWTRWAGGTWYQRASLSVILQIYGWRPGHVPSPGNNGPGESYLEAHGFARAEAHDQSMTSTRYNPAFQPLRPLLSDRWIAACQILCMMYRLPKGLCPASG